MGHTLDLSVSHHTVRDGCLNCTQRQAKLSATPPRIVGDTSLTCGCRHFCSLSAPLFQTVVTLLQSAGYPHFYRLSAALSQTVVTLLQSAGHPHFYRLSAALFPTVVTLLESLLLMTPLSQVARLCTVNDTSENTFLNPFIRNPYYEYFQTGCRFLLINFLSFLLSFLIFFSFLLFLFLFVSAKLIVLFT